MENNDLQHYKNMVMSYFNIVKDYEELTSKYEKRNSNLFMENTSLKYTNDCYKNNIERHIKDRLKKFIGVDVEEINIRIDKILIVDDHIRILLDESGGFEFFIRYDGTCIYEDNNGYITDQANETENLSDKARFYYDNRNELINILREYMIYSDKF
ncbi:hypothetical protein SZ43_04340 [Brachyspira hyodysenteriae]|uniref:hypothetical protein n=1 Tax=Brachyspira hyodysenteriae TaxID=159 RepID=UPI00063DC886|nr:hypothetical protein [Brachyspira hyodysenteriae]KLI54238.1 hypothetical protein SZ43_04340 [Brachyspira hyodysenteriae]